MYKIRLNFYHESDISKRVRLANNEVLKIQIVSFKGDLNESILTINGDYVVINSTYILSIAEQLGIQIDNKEDLIAMYMNIMQIIEKRG